MKLTLNIALDVPEGTQAHNFAAFAKAALEQYEHGAEVLEIKTDIRQYKDYHFTSLSVDKVRQELDDEENAAEDFPRLVEMTDEQLDSFLCRVWLKGWVVFGLEGEIDLEALNNLAGA